MRPHSRIVVVLGCVLLSAALAFAKERSPVSEPVPDGLLRRFCKEMVPKMPDEKPYVGVLRDREGRLGGFMSHSGVLDSPISWYDRSGTYLTTFHIFAPDQEKAAASAIIDPLVAKYPVTEPLVCPGDRWPARKVQP